MVVFGAPMLNANGSSDAPTAEDGSTADLKLLTAAQAAAMLAVDPKTFRTLQVPYIRVRKSKRYTVALLRAWEQRSVQECPAASPRPTPGWARRHDCAGSVRRAGLAAASVTPLADFATVAGLKPRKQPVAAD